MGESRVVIPIFGILDVTGEVIGMWVMALLISSSIICTTDMTPKIFRIPWLGFLGYAAAGAIVCFLVVRHFLTRPKVQTPVCKDADAAPISQAKGQGF